MELKILQAGYCTQIEKIAIKSGKIRKIEFPAIFALIKHPEIGYILFDTGYSKHVLNSLMEFPYGIYGNITPIRLTEGQSAKEQLELMGISCLEVRYIIISHFHADHIGGCKDFPNARFICSKTDYQKIRDKRGIKALIHGFVPSILPSDFDKRVEFLEDKSKAEFPISNSVFSNGYDIFNDKTIFAVVLAGHTAGQIGVFISSSGENFFLVSDACWLSDTYRRLLFPSKVSRLIVEDYKKYLHNIMNLHSFSNQYPHIRIIPSHCTKAFSEYSKSISQIEKGEGKLI